MTSAICEWCDRPFTPKRSERSRFCDRRCVALAREAARRAAPKPSKLTATCACGCGELMPAINEHGRPRRYLYRHNPKSRPIRTCPVCGKEFRHRGASLFCSRACSSHSRINGSRLERSGAAYRRWRLAVLERDNYTCRGCWRKGGRLHAHHIQEFAEHPDLRLIVDNGLTLCPACHSWEHKRALAPGIDLTRHMPRLFLQASA